MLEIVDRNIRITRGDLLPITVTANNEIDGKDYEFQAGDVVRFKIFDSKDNKKVYLQKDFKVEGISTEKSIEIPAEEMKIGEMKNKPIDYWYEIEVNPDTARTMTIEGYRKDEGPAIITILPEGGEKASEGGEA